MSKIKEVSTQIATSMTADFDENTWTFLMPENYKVWVGQFAIVDKQVYDKMKEIIEYVDRGRFCKTCRRLARKTKTA